MTAFVAEHIEVAELGSLTPDIVIHKRADLSAAPKIEPSGCAQLSATPQLKVVRKRAGSAVSS